LEIIKSTKGVENIVLTQRDGNPIQFSGVWLSKDEIFNVSAATAAIYNCGIALHQDDLKYILIEGKQAKILISPLKNYGSQTLNKIIDAQGLQGNDNEFFIAVTARNDANLGGIFLKTRESLIEIKKSLILSGESFKPPLRHFSTEEINKLINSLNVKDDLNRSETLNVFSLNISDEHYAQLDECLKEFGTQTLDLLRSYITIDGGFIAASYNNSSLQDIYLLDSEASMSYSLFSTSDKCAWLLKKMRVESILLECNNYFQFIQKAGSGIFSTQIAKGRQKLGLLRLIIPRYATKITHILEEAKNNINTKQPILDFKSMFNELVL
jgi:predicted regulator of Ras-like GTPase activity (Roadblock/LC7/MglB family)